ncbi:beta-1,2-xylosyltransferase XYXT1-like isoform X2 [Populus nigra]|uniref:beta-1,2-xylosyltransferase XYXT1-like isoform X2 n=1 Tax=Populus nigra TaxID=3691 RepID=UPI002B26E2EB|nr:beta-1,2-xylosyltransferase XYXT1-like isoform X2 [Populus nigra]
MIYDTVLARSFSKHEQKRLGYWALIACLFIVLSFFTIFKPYLGPLQVLNLRLSMGEDEKLHLYNDTTSSWLIAKEETIDSTLIVNDKRSSQEEAEIMSGALVVNDTDRTHEEAESSVAESIMNISSIVNGTSNSQEVFRESVTQNVKTNDTISSSPQKVKEITSKDDFMVNNTNISLPKATDAVTKNNKMEPLCTIMGRSDFCEIKGDIRIDGSSYTVFIVSSETDILAAENTSWRIRPYARKGDQTAMGAVREWTLKLVAGGSDIPQCTQNHSVPGILFSAGGYAGNHFHAFTDIIVPLFSTARPYNGEVQFLITNGWSAWIAKFKTILKALSRYELINIDNRKDIHCFGSMTVGLKRPSYKELSIDPSKSPYSIKDFRQFLRSSYSLKKTRAIKIRNGAKKRPRLLIISRKRSRAFTNVGEIVNMAERLGFRVVVAEPGMDVSGFSQIINSCDVVMGVHGAGLTNVVFLPEKAVLIQVIPFGGAEWLSRTFFEEPAKDMNIRYLDYKIRVEESTLIQQYPADHAVLRDPSVIGKQGWLAFQLIYLQKQNVTIDVNRFRPTLVKALELLHQ